jgi:hypothetical protein
MQFTQPKSAAASLQEAIARVNASLAAAGFTWALESAYGYTRERRNGQAAGGSGAALVDQVDSWCVVGKVPSKAVSFKVIGKVRELKAHGGFTSVGWRQDKDDWTHTTSSRHAPHTKRKLLPTRGPARATGRTNPSTCLARPS